MNRAGKEGLTTAAAAAAAKREYKKKFSFFLLLHFYIFNDMHRQTNFSSRSFSFRSIERERTNNNNRFLCAQMNCYCLIKYDLIPLLEKRRREKKPSPTNERKKNCSTVIYID